LPKGNVRMKKRILSLATVAAPMALMLVAMASAALAVPPASSSTGCDGGQSTAHHNVGYGYSSGEIQAQPRNTPAGERGLDRADDNTEGAHCQLP
jgi:hypothetical protein